ncbi:MAG: helix-turn-helix transcriptional regulator [Bacteroidia bacterium]|nr:helix-turn-helix transcriptional regulator [Bacteroidia bacterium]
MPNKFRSDCPIASAVDILGDRWMLVIVKQMLLEDRWTFKDFRESDEPIASNILSSKLKLLEEYNIVEKSKLPNNKKTNIYHLTDRGLSLAPIIVELALWSDANLRGLNKIMRKDKELEFMRNDREGFIELLKENYRTKLSALLQA